MDRARGPGNPPVGYAGLSDDAKDRISTEFEKLYYDCADTTWKSMSWMGVPIQKNPFDLWMYQQLIFKLKPDLIIETGTLYGGSALYLAHLCELIGKGSVVTIDVNPPLAQVRHGRLDSFTVSSIDPMMITNIERLIQWRHARTVMVLLDSDHSEDHVSRELELYHPFVTPGSYLVVEDTNLNSHPVWPEYGPGPYEAVEKFQAQHPEFERDVECERFLMTFNKNGYLRRVSEDAH